MNDAIYWVWLNMIPNIQPKKIKALLDVFKSPEHVIKACKKELIEKAGMDNDSVSKFIKERDNINAEEELLLAKKKGISFITYNDIEYPVLLKNIFDPPIVLYLKGSLLPSDNISVAIVGSRKSTYYGEQAVSKIVAGLSDAGIAVVSGMARGIDTIAHKTALKRSLRTIAVLGCGLNNVYPPENKMLMSEIAGCGAVISEFPMKTGPDKYNFPRRNRIISGMSLGTVVVEAGEKSGALITADFALEQGKEVFGVPGNINSAMSRGVNQLIKKGAKLVESAEDIIEEIKYSVPNEQISKITGSKQREIPLEKMEESELKVFSLLTEEPKHIDELMRQGELKASEINSLLINLELKGFIKQLPGKMFVRL